MNPDQHVPVSATILGGGGIRTHLRDATELTPNTTHDEARAAMNSAKS